MFRTLPCLALILLGGCAIGDRGLESPHQPVVNGNTASVPDCPKWDHEVGGERESQSSNYGCASATNLAAMIADPVDLLHGRSDSTPPEVGSRAIKAWREVAPTYKNWVVTVQQSSTGGH